MIGPRLPKQTEREKRAAYNLVTQRDKGICVRCGSTGPTERDHRQNRDPFNTVPSNLQLLGGPFGCGCHLWKTENPEEAMRTGFSVPSWERPELWPAWRVDVGGFVLYFDGPDEYGRLWRGITQATADLLMNGGTDG